MAAAKSNFRLYGGNQPFKEVLRGDKPLEYILTVEKHDEKFSLNKYRYLEHFRLNYQGGDLTVTPDLAIKAGTLAYFPCGFPYERYSEMGVTSTGKSLVLQFLGRTIHPVLHNGHEHLPIDGIEWMQSKPPNASYKGLPQISEALEHNLDEGIQMPMGEQQQSEVNDKWKAVQLIDLDQRPMGSHLGLDNIWVERWDHPAEFTRRGSMRYRQLVCLSSCAE